MIPDATRLAHLAPLQRAEFAVTARLLSCLVTESLLRALYFSLSDSSATGFALVLLHDPASQVTSAKWQLTDVFAFIPLQGTPVLTDREDNSMIREIALLDPLDMVPLPLVISKNDLCRNGTGNPLAFATAILDTLNAHGWFAQSRKQLEICWDPVFYWRLYARFANLTSDLTEEVAHEFANSVKWQAYSYQNPPVTPSFHSTSIEWEQSIVEGHPTHPMHKMRYFVPPLPDYAPGTYNLYHIKLRFVSVPKSQLKITNDFEEYIKPVIETASRHAGTQIKVPADRLVMPVHELQISHIQDKFPDIEVLPSEFMVSAHAQQSIRSVQVPDAYDEFSLKLAIGLKLTQAVRAISPAAAYLGPRFSSQVVPRLKLDPDVVTVAKELASVVHAHPDPEVAKYCGAIVREAHENNSERRGEKVIVCAALLESGHTGEGGHLPAVIRIFQLDTEEKRRHWLDRFVQLFFRAFLPSIIHNGVAFEFHPQNCLARFDLKTKELRGFIIRDFGGIRIHPETLYASTGVELDCLPGHSIAVPNLDDVYTRAYHAAVHNHLQQLIRVLDLHYNGQGWEIVRQHLMQAIPKEHGLYNAWLSPERKMVPSKCFLRMRMAKMYRFHLYSSVPNLIIHCGLNTDMLFCDES
ncbi:IucC family-domain-containing protein [Amanita rubescens]|nr:IucC family-domain-containing protein [Amanita rubescens]